MREQQREQGSRTEGHLPMCGVSHKTFNFNFQIRKLPNLSVLPASVFFLSSSSSSSLANNLLHPLSFISFLPNHSIFLSHTIMIRLQLTSKRILHKWSRTVNTLLLNHTASFNNNQVRWHGGPTVSADAPSISLTFLQPDGETKQTVTAKVGESFLQTAHRHDIDLEGACEGRK